MSVIGHLYIELDTLIGVYSCRGNPNDLNIRLPKGSLMLDVDTPALYQSNDGDASDWSPAAGGGGGVGGGSGSLARAFVAGTDSDVVNPDPVTPTLVPGMTLELTLAETTMVKIDFLTHFTSAGGSSRFAIYQDGTKIWPEWGSEVGWWDDEGDGASFYKAEGMCILELTAGTYTIEVKESASGSTSAKTYYSRILEVQELA